MKNILLFILFACLAFSVQGQNKGKIAWFLTPEVGTMFLDGHLGKTVGASFGVQLFKQHLKVGILGYGRSGPINGAAFTTSAHNNLVYKGERQLTLRADHGAFGLMLAPTFKINNIVFDAPISIGSVGGGFYLFGEDRNTPDGRRVSEWENELMDGRDATFGGMLEFGLRGFFPTKIQGMRWGIGLHYTTTQGWETYYDPSGNFYNNKLRASLFIHFGSN
jgi:hypothetical protein